ncbi:MAG: hypothetical protein QOF51_157 [Chloroflexota bacterium]|jgi:nicotinate-nucleotide pyrophosphorylase (carboxylating)|nr:hypothetical protein [Chloroflexota bacterium]
MTATRRLAIETLEVPIADLQRMVATALEEDLGWGDITTDNLVPADATARAALAYREPGVVCGLRVVAEVFRAIDERIVVEPRAQEGDHVATGATVAIVRGPARGILKGERVALNFIQRMGAIATATGRYVAAIEGTRTHVIDTRKTTPGLRALERYAVRVGGGRNHRFNLSDGVLVKDNHLAAMRSQGIGTVEALRQLRDRIPHTVKIEVEVDRVDQIPDMIEGGADVILLDNFRPEQVGEAVRVISGRAAIEISGGVRFETIREYAAHGVDVISVGALTHSTPALDIGLDFELEEPGRA